MGSSRKRGSAGERVLEGRHVIGLFLLMLVFSGLFFTLGYVMGRDGQVRAADGRGFTPPEVLPKAEAASKSSARTPTTAEPASDSETPSSSDWEFYHAGDSSKADDRLQPVSNAAPVSNAGRSSNVKQAGPPPRGAAPMLGAGGINLQIMALTKENDAMAVATSLRKKNFPTFVQPPQHDKYYHVLVGPYPDQKSAEAARKALEAAGFNKVLVKR
jgi:septal ring-binding cell division protein DamX